MVDCYVRCGNFVASTAVAFACVFHYPQARGASLVERYKAEPGKAKKAAGGKEGGKKTFSWSREEDFEQRKKFTPQVLKNKIISGVLSILEEAKLYSLCIIVARSRGGWDV